MTENNHALSIGYELTTYTIDRILGQGGFGIVYQAHHSYLNDKFVIKEFLPSSLATRSTSNASIVPVSKANNSLFDDSYKRFIDEGRTLRKLKHPNIVRCTDLFEANGTAYLVMEFEDGLPFDELLKSLEATGGQYSEAHLLQVFIPLAEGLEYVHQQNVLHRDIKPGNVFIRRSDNSPVLLDFGAAKQNFAEVSQSQAPFTDFYAPIDQLDTTLKPTAQIDIHAFGGLMYRAVTGTIGPRAEKRSYALSRGEKDPLEPASKLAKGKYSDSLLLLIDQCLSFLPENRPRSMAEVNNRLRSLIGEEAQQAPSNNFGQLNELIALAGSDGIITEVEMAHLLKKATELGLDHSQAIQQITSQCHTNGWEFEIGIAAKPKESITKTESEFSENEQKEFLAPFIELAGADGIISEHELSSIIENGIKKSINPNFALSYIQEKARQNGWQIDAKERDSEKPDKKSEIVLDDFIENQKLTLEQTKSLISSLISQLKAIKPLNYDRLNVDSSTIWVNKNLTECGFSEDAFLTVDPREKYQDISLFSFAPEYYLDQKIEQTSVVYSLSCIAYFCLTGTRVWTDERLEDDQMVPLGSGGNNFFKAIDWGMNLKKTQRPSSINQWVKSWTHGVPEKKEASNKKKEPSDAEKKSSENNKSGSQEKPKQSANNNSKQQTQPQDSVKRERPKKLVYKPTFLDYLDTFFLFVNTALFMIFVASLGWVIVSGIIEWIGDFSFKKSTNRNVALVLIAICVFAAFPKEVEKNGLLKASERYANISLFFLGVVIIGIIATIIYFV